MLKIELTQLGTSLKVKVLAGTHPSTTVQGKDLTLIISDTQPSFVFSDHVCLCCSSDHEVVYMSSTYRECADLCSRLADACTSAGIGVTVKNDTPIWFSLSASGEGVDVEIEHIDPNYTGRYENDCFCFSDRTDRRKTKLTLCPERLKAGQILTFRNCKINLIYADVSLRRILSTLSSVDRVEAPAGSVCEVKGNRFRHMGSNRLLVGGKVVAYKYPALGGWSDKYTHRLEVSHVIIE